jgi:YD repeat-containing protein
MTGRERHGLRGPVKTVITETFEWDQKAGAITEKPSRREELTFSPQGNLLESIPQFEGRLIQRSTNVYEEDGRLREIRFHNSDGTESSLAMKYDPHGQPIRFGATVTYSSENWRKIKTEVFEPQTPGVNRALGFEDSPSEATFWTTGNAAVAVTFFDGKGRPAELVLYDDEHVKIRRHVRSYDERGRVSSEECQTLSPRVLTGQQGTQREAMPEEMVQLFARILSQRPMRMTYKYDDQDRVIEQTREIGLFGYERTVSVYNERGDLSKQQSYSTRQDMPVDEEGNILAPPPAPERLESETEFSHEYDCRGNWTRKKTATPHLSKFRWESVETRSITYY